MPTRELPKPRRRVFLDTNVCCDVASGLISADDWETARGFMIADFEYCISPLTAQELVYSIERGSAQDFIRNRKRIAPLLSPAPVRFLDFPRQFIRRELNGLVHRISAEIEAGFLDWFSVILWVEGKADLEKPVVLPYMTDEFGFQSSASTAAKIFVDLQKSYVESMEAARRKGQFTLDADAWASEMLIHSGLTPNKENIATTKDRLDASYRFEACLYNLAKNPNYSFSERDSDLVDCQQLNYLIDPGMYFITQDSHLRKWINGSTQAHRVLSLSEFLQYCCSKFDDRV